MQRARLRRGRWCKAFHGSCVCRGRTFDLVDHEGAGVELGLQGLVVGLRHLATDGERLWWFLGESVIVCARFRVWGWVEGVSGWKLWIGFCAVSAAAATVTLLSIEAADWLVSISCTFGRARPCKCAEMGDCSNSRRIQTGCGQYLSIRSQRTRFSEELEGMTWDKWRFTGQHYHEDEEKWKSSEEVSFKVAYTRSKTRREPES